MTAPNPLIAPTIALMIGIGRSFAANASQAARSSASVLPAAGDKDAFSVALNPTAAATTESIRYATSCVIRGLACCFSSEGSATPNEAGDAEHWLNALHQACDDVGGRSKTKGPHGPRARSPHNARLAPIMIVRPIATKPSVTIVSCRAGAPWPAAVIGDSAAVPRIAASVVTNQLP